MRCKITGCDHSVKQAGSKKIKFWEKYQICKCCYVELVQYEPKFKLPNHSKNLTSKWCVKNTSRYTTTQGLEEQWLGVK